MIFANDTKSQTELSPIEFCNQILSRLAILEQNEHATTQELNQPFNTSELDKAILKLKDGKATGIDNIKNEILKMRGMSKLLLTLYNHCFEVGIDKVRMYEEIMTNDDNLESNLLTSSLLKNV